MCDPLAGGVADERILGEKLKRLLGEEESWGEFCCCRTFVLIFGDVEMNFGDVDMTEDGDDAELLVPWSCLKLLMVRLRQTFRNFDGSLFSLLLSLDDGDKMNEFDATPTTMREKINLKLLDERGLVTVEIYFLELNKKSKIFSSDIPFHPTN